MKDALEQKGLGKHPYRIIPGLGTAVMCCNVEKTMQLLSIIPPGEKVMILGLVLELDIPTERERKLLEKSVKEHKEYGLITVGERTMEVEGKRGRIDDDEVWKIVRKLVKQDGKSEKREFSHTHYDKEAPPIFSAPDATVMSHLTEGWGFTCRLVSWLPNTAFIFRGTM